MFVHLTAASMVAAGAAGIPPASGFPPASRVLGGGGGSGRAADGAVQITELGTESGLAAGEREAAAGGSTGVHFLDASSHADWETRACG